MVCDTIASAQANSKEREKAKRARKEARKLEQCPVPILTEDPVAWEPSSKFEQQEVASWVAERKANFPTAFVIERRRLEAEALAASGAF